MTPAARLEYMCSAVECNPTFQPRDVIIMLTAARHEERFVVKWFFVVFFFLFRHCGNYGSYFFFLNRTGCYGFGPGSTNS